MIQTIIEQECTDNTISPQASSNYVLSKKAKPQTPHMQETPSFYLWQIDMPKFEKEDFKISIVKRIVSITGESWKNNAYYSFRKSFLLPSNVEVNQVSANYEGDILWIKMPKALQHVNL